jgi:hypothetical protein
MGYSQKSHPLHAYVEGNEIVAKCHQQATKLCGFPGSQRNNIVASNIGNLDGIPEEMAVATNFR